MKILIKKVYLKVIQKLKSARFKYDKLFIFIIDIAQNENLKNTFEITKANTIDDIKEIVLERKGGFDKMYNNWFSKGFICFVAKEKETPVGIVWLNRTKEVPLEFGYKQKLRNKNEAGLIDAYVLKEKRGKGVYKKIWNIALHEAQGLGIETLYGYILQNNIRSIQVHYKLGMKNVYQILFYVRILWFNLYFKKTFHSLKDISLLAKF